MSDPGIGAVYQAANTFSVQGNRTLEFIDYRRVKANCGTDGYRYSSISNCSYDSVNDRTTVTLFDDCLTLGLTEIWYAVISPGKDGSFPERLLKNVTKRQVLIFG